MRVGFIGCGNMAKAMISGIVAQGMLSAQDVQASTSHAESAQKAAEQLGIAVGTDNLAVVDAADALFLTVKPQMYAAVLAEIKDKLRPDQVLVTVAPGKTMAWVAEQLGREVKIVRTAPNTPALVGCGVTGCCANDLVDSAEFDNVKGLLASFGTVEEVPERLLDVVMTLGGCSPAYVYMFIEAMADAAVAEGLPRESAYRIAAQAVCGSAKMVLETGLHPGQLKDQVTSPAGTTIEGLEALEQGAFRGTVMAAIRAASQAGRAL